MHFTACSKHVKTGTSSGAKEQLLPDALPNATSDSWTGVQTEPRSTTLTMEQLVQYLIKLIYQTASVTIKLCWSILNIAKVSSLRSKDGEREVSAWPVTFDLSDVRHAADTEPIVLPNTIQHFLCDLTSPFLSFEVNTEQPKQLTAPCWGHFDVGPVHILDVTKVTLTSMSLLQTATGLIVIS